MDKQENAAPQEKQHVFPALLPAVILIGTVIAFAAGSLSARSRGTAAQSLVWKPLLHAYDSVRLGLGADCIGNVYLINGRMLRRTTEYSEEAILASAEAVSRYAAATEAPVCCAAVPTGAGVYAKLLSENAPRSGETAALRSFTAALGDGIAALDLSSTFENLREETGYEIYYRTDPRWTSFGAFCAYQVIIRRLGLNAVGYDRFAVWHRESSYYGTLAQEIQYFDVQPDIIDLYTNGSAPEITRGTVWRADGTAQSAAQYYDTDAAGYAVFRSAAAPVVRMENALQNNRALLLLCDSYGAPVVPFLMQHYQSVTAVNLELADTLDWRAVTGDLDYTQVLILLSAETVAKEDGLRALNTETDSERNILP